MMGIYFCVCKRCLEIYSLGLVWRFIFIIYFGFIILLFFYWRIIRDCKNGYLNIKYRICILRYRKIRRRVEVLFSIFVMILLVRMWLYGYIK